MAMHLELIESVDIPASDEWFECSVQIESVFFFSLENDLCFFHFCICDFSGLTLELTFLVNIKY